MPGDSMPRIADPALPERRRAQILEAARACFQEHGFRQTTIEEVCAQARISPGALYRYFAAKADIVAAIALDARSDAEAALDRLNGAAQLIDGLTELAHAFFAACDNNREAALIGDVWAEAAHDPLLAKALSERAKTTTARIAAAINHAQRDSEIYPALASAEAAEILMAALDGMALRRAIFWEGPAELARRFRLLALHILKPKR